MSYQPFLSEIQWVAFNFAPKNWALCNGQFLPINQNQALFSLLGTTYGGNGQTTFALPDLRGRVPIGVGAGYVLGETGGAQAHTVSIQELPTHAHTYPVTDHRGTTGEPRGATGVAFASGEQAFTSPAVVNAAFHPSAVSAVGGSQPHQNMQPHLGLNAIIALVGIFPSRP